MIETAEGPPSDADVLSMLRQRSRQEPRVKVPRRMADRKAFEEVLDTYTEDQAKAEASRCLRCDLMCSVCASVCPNRAFFTYRTVPLVSSVDNRSLEVSQSFQTAVLTDFCNECGNCATFCPTAGGPYRHKPRLYVTRSEFEEQNDNAFFISHDGEEWAVEARTAGETAKLTLGEQLHFELRGAGISLDPDTLQVVDGAGGDGDVELCFDMLVLLRGLRGSMGHLPF